MRGEAKEAAKTAPDDNVDVEEQAKLIESKADSNAQTAKRRG